METITQAVQSASNALWNEVDALRGGQQTKTEQRVPQQQQHGEEPLSGVQGKGTATDPYDAGNRDDQLGAPISKDNTAAMTEAFSSTTTGISQNEHQNPNANEDKAALVTSNIGPSNPSVDHPAPVVGKQHTTGPAGKGTPKDESLTTHRSTLKDEPLSTHRSTLKDEPLSTHRSTLKDEPLSTHKSTLKDEPLTFRPKPNEPATTYNTRSANAATAAEKVSVAGSSAGVGSGVAAGAGTGTLSGSTAATTEKPTSEQRGNISFSHAQSVSQPKDKKPFTSGTGGAESVSQPKDKEFSTSGTGAASSVSPSKSKGPSTADISARQAPRRVTENSSGPTTAGAGVAPADVSKNERKEPITASTGAGAGADAETTQSGSAEKLAPSTDEVAEKHGVSKEALRGPSCPPPRESYEKQMQGAESQKEKDDQRKTSKNG
ncbi:hypothetical protein BDW66DRAFT_108988 [Aspergillus desertorum]